MRVVACGRDEEGRNEAGGVWQEGKWRHKKTAILVLAAGRKGVAVILSPHRVPPSLVNSQVRHNGGENADEGAGPVDRPADGV